MFPTELVEAVEYHQGGGEGRGGLINFLSEENYKNVLSILLIIIIPFGCGSMRGVLAESYIDYSC